MALMLPNWPYEGQLDSVTDDGQPDENRENNCGETCDSMVLRWGLGLVIPPDAIKDVILGPGPEHTGYSYVNQNSDYLNTKGVTTRYEEVTDPADAYQRRMNALRQGHPTITLFYANRQTLAGGHFMTDIGVDNANSAVVANPWIGGPEGLTPQEWQRIYNGWQIYCEIEALHAQPPTKPKPSGKAPRYLVLTSMMARKQPKLDVTPENIYFLPNGKPQLVNAGAVLNGTGQMTPHFRQVTAGSNKVWLFEQNLRPV